MLPAYPNLVAEVAKRGIKHNTVATALGISSRTLSNKIYGRTEFTWSEARMLKNDILPDCEYEYLFNQT